jgi:hypothetical protein
MSDHPHRGLAVSTRQQVLVLYLSSTSLEGNVAGWAFYNGLEEDLYYDDDTPPYETGVAALKDGWRMISYPTLHDIDRKGGEHDLGYFKNEFVFEKLISESAK